MPLALRTKLRICVYVKDEIDRRKNFMNEIENDPNY